MSYTMYSSSRNSGRGRSSSYGRNNSRSGGNRGPKKEYIHPSRFIQAALITEREVYVPTHEFADFAIHPLLQANLQAMGFKTPSAIQDQTIPVGLEGKDIVGIANTGTGKTAAFAIPLLQKLMTDKTSRALILAPTRELAQQIEEQCRALAKGSGLTGALLIGGTAMGGQLRDLRNKPQIIIGTPGRTKDHMEQGTLKLDDCNIVVLDEVDRMLDMGFIDDIRFILGKTSQTRQCFFFSATLDARVTTIIQSFANEPVHVSVKTGDTSENVEQNIVSYGSKEDKMNKLHDLLLSQGVTKALIFDDTHRSVEKLMQDLQSRGFETDAIHGGKSQPQRQRALKRFRDNQISILVATDVAARGIDVADISHVVNFSQPQSYSDYVHRIGRAGRAGRQGYALTFVEA